MSLATAAPPSPFRDGLLSLLRDIKGSRTPKYCAFTVEGARVTLTITRTRILDFIHHYALRQRSVNQWTVGTSSSLQKILNDWGWSCAFPNDGPASFRSRRPGDKQPVTIVLTLRDWDGMVADVLGWGEDQIRSVMAAHHEDTAQRRRESKKRKAGTREEVEQGRGKELAKAARTAARATPRAKKTKINNNNNNNNSNNTNTNNNSKAVLSRTDSLALAIQEFDPEVAGLHRATSASYFDLSVLDGTPCAPPPQPPNNNFSNNNNSAPSSSSSSSSSFPSPFASGLPRRNITPNPVRETRMRLHDGERPAKFSASHNAGRCFSFSVTTNATTNATSSTTAATGAEDGNGGDGDDGYAQFTDEDVSIPALGPIGTDNHYHHNNFNMDGVMGQGFLGEMDLRCNEDAPGACDDDETSVDGSTGHADLGGCAPTASPSLFEQHDWSSLERTSSMASLSRLELGGSLEANEIDAFFVEN